MPANHTPSTLKRAVWSALFVSCLVFLASLYAREITLDDAYFAEQAYWFEKNGYVRSELFRGVLNWEERSFVYHKLHVWQGALLIKLAGWNPYFFKSLPLLYLVLFVFLVRFYLYKFITEDRTVFLLLLSLLLIHTFISQYGFEFRPEIMIMTIGFASFVGIRYGLLRNNMPLILVAGGLAGATALMHLNGLVFVAAGIGLLLYNKAYRALFIFGCASTLVFSLYFIELIPGDNFARFLFQFRNDPAVHEDELGFWGWLLKFVTGPIRFFSHVYEAAFTLLFLFALIAHWKQVMRSDELKQVLVYLLLVELTLSVISPDAKTMYLTYHVPYMLIVISATFYSALQHNRLRNALFVLLFLYVATQLGHTYSISTRKNLDKFDTYAHIVDKYRIDRRHKLLAPEIFVFNEKTNTAIQGFISLGLGYPGEKALSTFANLLGFAGRNSKDFIIADKDMLEHLGAQELQVGATYGQYQLAGVEGELYVFRHVTVRH